jgi:hypothetical protein
LEIKAIEQELSKSQLSSSNLEIAVKKGIAISKKASQLWVSNDYSDSVENKNGQPTKIE